MFALMALLLAVFLPPDGQNTLLKTFRDEFVRISPGTDTFPRSFVMGCPDSKGFPPRIIELEHEFYIGKYEVTQNLWQFVMGENPSRWKGSRNSVERLSFQDAQVFCQRVTVLLRKSKLIEPGEVVRLPTEAEWEYAARAGTTTKYSFGDDASQLNEYAWSTRNAAGNDPAVGVKKPNPWGLYDAHGYLWEWCQLDSNKRLPSDGSKQAVVRGGSWKDEAEKLTSCSRKVVVPTSRDDAIGLRCVLAKE